MTLALPGEKTRDSMSNKFRNKARLHWEWRERALVQPNIPMLDLPASVSQMTDQTAQGHVFDQAILPCMRVKGLHPF